MPIQVIPSYSTRSGMTLNNGTSTNAPSNVTGTLNQVVGVPKITATSPYNSAGGIVLSSSNRGNSSLNYYQLNGSNNYQFSFFRHLAKSHIVANQFILASAGPVNLDVRDLDTGNSNSYFLPRICQKNILFSGGIKFMYAGTSDIYLICNKDSDPPKKAMLYRYNRLSASFDAGQIFNPGDKVLSSLRVFYKAASSKNGIVRQQAIVFLEQSEGNISYINTCKDSSTLGNCQPQAISGINNVGFITSGVITDRMIGVSLDGYDALFVGNSNTIFKVNLSINGKYKGYSTY